MNADLQALVSRWDGRASALPIDLARAVYQCARELAALLAQRAQPRVKFDGDVEQHITQLDTIAERLRAAHFADEDTMGEQTILDRWNQDDPPSALQYNLAVDVANANHREVIRLRAQLAGLPAWRPMSTAPKDGTEIVVAVSVGWGESEVDAAQGWYDVDGNLVPTPLRWMPYAPPAETP